MARKSVVGDHERLLRRSLARAALTRSLSVPVAAKELGVSERTLWRWLAQDPAIREGLELPAARGGVPVTAARVTALRDLTGCGLADCLAALQASQGDQARAVAWLHARRLLVSVPNPDTCQK